MNKKMILSFDGLDNVGKSTQIKKVREWLKDIDFVILNLDSPIGETNLQKVKYGSKVIENYFKTWKLLWKESIPQINDRTHYSEYAYRMFRDSDKIDDILKMEKKYGEIIEESLIFTFIDKVENIAKRDDGHSQYDKDDLDAIKKLTERFKFISKKSIFENYIIDIEGKDEDEVFEIIKKKIENKFFS